MDDLVQWLRAVLDDEATAQGRPETAWHRRDCGSLPDVLYPGQETGACDCGVPAQVLREIEAKRAVLGAFAEVVGNYGRDDVEYADGWVSGLGFAVQHMAAAYSDRAGYREEWRPE